MCLLWRINHTKSRRDGVGLEYSITKWGSCCVIIFTLGGTVDAMVAWCLLIKGFTELPQYPSGSTSDLMGETNPPSI